MKSKISILIVSITIAFVFITVGYSQWETRFVIKGHITVNRPEVIEKVIPKEVPADESADLLDTEGTLDMQQRESVVNGDNSSEAAITAPNIDQAVEAGDSNSAAEGNSAAEDTSSDSNSAAESNSASENTSSDSNSAVEGNSASENTSSDSNSAAESNSASENTSSDSNSAAESNSASENTSSDSNSAAEGNSASEDSSSN